MFLRSSSFARGVVLLLALGVSTVACGRYSISNLRSVKAFKDGTALYQKSDFAGAAAKFEESIANNGEQGMVYFFLGNSYENMYKPARKGEPANDAHMMKAVENYQKATEKITGNTETDIKYRRLSYDYLASAYGPEKLNDFSKAEPIAQKLISLDPADPTPYQALGGLYEGQGRYEDAEAMFKKAVEVKPSDPTVYTYLAGFYNRQGKFPKTMEALNQRAAAEPNNPEAYHTMATYYWDEASHDRTLTPAQKREYILKGIEADDKALALNPNYTEALTYKNILLRMQALTEKDPAVQKRLINEADELRNKAIGIMKKNTSTGKK
jgi:tetratricopeptide (TPR) repeat protein